MRIEKEKVHSLISPRPLILITVIDILDAVDAVPTDFISPVVSNPPVIMVALKPETNVYQSILQRKEFVVNILSKEY